jgi:hypothetical protein
MTSDDDYDKLSKEEREIRDKADRMREAEEQAGTQKFLLGAPSSHLCIWLAALPYKWRQELGELDLIVPVPKGTRGKDLIVVIQKKTLSVGLKGKDKIMDGELCQEIKVEESTWTIGESRFTIFLLLLTCYRGPGSGSYPPRKDQQDAVVG